MMSERAPYGSWKSPITSELIASAAVRPGDVACDGQDVYVSESRPAEGGRSVVVHLPPGGPARSMTPEGQSARTRVHEYGGGAFAVSGGRVVYSRFEDGRLQLQEPSLATRPLTAEGPLRYADLGFDVLRDRVVCVVEDHGATPEPRASIGAVSLATGSRSTLVAGSDFYAAPRVSPDGLRLAWLSWSHPNMPWDGTELWAAELSADGALGAARKIAGGPDESICQPEWGPDGALYFVSDRSGFWNLYAERGGAVVALCPMEAEFGLPHWVFGTCTYGVLGGGTLLVTYLQDGHGWVAELDPGSGVLRPIAVPYSEVSGLRVAGTSAVFIGASATESPCLVRLDVPTGRVDVLRRFSTLEVDRGYLSVPELVTFPTTGGVTAHALYYRPRNRDFEAPPGERPPLLVKSHGGPTASASRALNLRTQYWTSRGFAVLDVDYGGSTGYGRAYRRRLDGRWGIVDVDDCVLAAQFLVERGEADPERLAISGGSAGGYTTLAALTFRSVFRAGASHYGVSDLEALARDTHKFESRYLDRLVGPYPEARALYLERSPIHHTDRLACPVIFFQGLEDRVVPPNQTERMVAALRAKGLPVAYVAFEGEQHGFRRADSIRRSIDGELYFYSRVFGFDLGGDVPTVPIENLKDSAPR